jgi:elongation factor 1-alpha
VGCEEHDHWDFTSGWGVLVIEARMGEQGQTREHAQLTHTVGIKQLIVAVNKMDDETVQRAKSRYDEIVGEFTRIVGGLGFRPEMYKFVTISTKSLVYKSSNVSWFSGRALLETLDIFVLPKRPLDSPLRPPVHGGYEISAIGTV